MPPNLCQLISSDVIYLWIMNSIKLFNKIIFFCQPIMPGLTQIISGSNPVTHGLPRIQFFWGILVSLFMGIIRDKTKKYKRRYQIPDQQILGVGTHCLCPRSVQCRRVLVLCMRKSYVRHRYSVSYLPLPRKTFTFPYSPLHLQSHAALRSLASRPRRIPHSGNL